MLGNTKGYGISARGRWPISTYELGPLIHLLNIDTRFEFIYSPAATAPRPARKLTATAMTGATPRPAISRSRALVAALDVVVGFPVPVVVKLCLTVPVPVLEFDPPTGPEIVASAAYMTDDVYVTQLDEAGVRTDGSEVTTAGWVYVETTPSVPVYTPTGSMLSESQTSNTPSWYWKIRCDVIHRHC